MFAGLLLENPGVQRVWIYRENKPNAYLTALDPTEAVTSDWIQQINALPEFLKANTAD